MKPIEDESIYGAWLQAAQHLFTCTDERDYNVILQINHPEAFDDHDRQLREVVDLFLKRHGKGSLDTVADTIFPLGLYQRFGLDGIFTKYPDVVYPKIRPVDWGRYAYRLVRVQVGRNEPVVLDPDTGEPINPLEKIINRLRNYANDPKRAIYEASLVDPVLDIPIYRPAEDRCYTMGGPCLSHISFKVTSDKRLSLTAFYRSHYYAERALGNLLGLSWLLSSVAQETGFAIGPLTCISSMAQMESGKKWNKTDLKTLLAKCEEVFEGGPVWSNRLIWIRGRNDG